MYMSNYARKSKRKNKANAKKERAMRQNNKWPCPYNHTLCGEYSCKGCGVYNYANDKTIEYMPLT